MELIRNVLNIISENDMSKTRMVKFKVKLKLWRIKDQDIINTIGMAEMSLIIYLFSLKYNRPPKLINIENDLMIRVGKCNVGRLSYLAVYLHFFKFENAHLTIEGNVSYPTVLGKCEMGAWFNQYPIKGTLLEIEMDKKLGNNIYETRTAFKIEFDLKEDTEIIFFNKTDKGSVAYGKINAMRFFPIADCIPEQYFSKEGWLFWIDGKKLICKKNQGTCCIEEKEKKFRKEIRKLFPQKYEWAIELRDFYFKKNICKNKPIWLFMDRPERADDNAKVLFKYVQNKSDIDSYFIISKSSNDYEIIRKIGKVIPLYSNEHYKMVLIADFIISSQCNGVIENPFWENAELFRDMYHGGKIIFLQHGVIKDDMSATLNRFNTNFTGFVTSTLAEYNSILDYPYYYTPKEVWLTGLPRFDELYNDPQKVILIMPSWRQGLMEQIWNEDVHGMCWELKSEFESSEYYHRYQALIQNDILIKNCKDKGYKILFMIHPLMKKYAEKFNVGAECMLADATLSYRDALAKGMLLVTDYSSVAFDFSFLKKPVIYYQFDKNQFFREHTYKPGYFDYENNGLGEVYESEKDIVNAIVKYLKRDCALRPKYEKRIDDLWKYKDGFCERAYHKIIEC